MERANIQIMRLLRHAGAEVLFITESGWGKAVSDAVKSADCKQIGIKMGRNLSLPRGPRDAIELTAYWMRVSRRIKAAFGSFRPTHLYLTNLSFFLLALPLPGKANVQTIFRLPNPPDPELHGWRQRLSHAIWKRLVIPRCNVFVCNSAYSRDRLRQLTGPEARIELIYNSYPQRSGGNESDAPALARDRFNIVYLGRIQKNKGVDLLYDSARQLVEKYRDVDFYFVGEHSWRNRFADTLIARNANDGLVDRIVFLNQVDDVPGLLQQAQLHVCPSTSRSESFPNVLLEAKYAGVPSVIFPVAGLPEAIVDGIDGSVCADISSKALTRKIEEYISRPELCRQHGTSARRSLEKYDESRVRDAWMRVLTNG
jgi:glycosyltransferase involved in cell wall biosynthesis